MDAPICSRDCQDLIFFLNENLTLHDTSKPRSTEEVLAAIEKLENGQVILLSNGCRFEGASLINHLAYGRRRTTHSLETLKKTCLHLYGGK